MTVWCALTRAAPGAHAAPIRTTKAVDEAVFVERGLAIVRLDPKPGAPAHECDELAPADLEVLIDGRSAPVASVEPVPRPERHWLVLDISESAEGRRLEAKRSALQYVREVLTPGIDSAALVTVDEDAVLVEGPTTDTDRLARAIERVPPGGASALVDGLDSVLRQIEGDRHEHLVLYWTDGLDNSSNSRPEDLFRTIARVPQATVFPLALMPSRTTGTQPRIGDFLFDVARRAGGQLFASSDPRWLDHVRGWIARRFTVAFSPPEEPPGEPPARKPSRPVVAFSTPGKRCVVTRLPDPFAQPDAVAGEAPPAPAAWVRTHQKRFRRGDDPACAYDSGEPPWDWPLEATGEGVGGCVLDLLETPGPIVKRKAPIAIDIATGRIASRKIAIAAPAVDRLAESAVDAFERLVPGEDDDPTSPSAVQMEGSAFLTQRARIAASLFASRPDYREFALARLARLAEDDIRTIERDFARAFPGLPPDKLEAVARASRAGARTLEAAKTPTDADLARVLAAWLGDVPAKDLFLDWERRLCDARIASGPDGTAFSRWTALRARLGYPWPVRVVAPLVPLHDGEKDLIGFVRIVAPRPEGFAARIKEAAPADTPPDDRVAPTPLGLWLLDRVASSSEIAKAVAAKGYRTRSITYAPVIPPSAGRAGRPPHRDRVTVLLAPPGSPSTVLTLDADIDTPDEGGPVLVRLDPTAAGDPDLAALVEPLQVAPRPDGLTPPATPLRSSRPRRAPCCGRRRGSSRARGARG